MRSRRARRSALVAALLAALVGAGCRPATGPQPIAYDREPCSHCRMLISEPRFAAQLETEDGARASFDDPGCLLAYLDARRPPVHALWFHHVREERWLSGEQVGFESVPHTPMGYGLGAVNGSAPGALSVEEARRRVASRIRPAPTGLAPGDPSLEERPPGEAAR